MLTDDDIAELIEQVRVASGRDSLSATETARIARLIKGAARLIAARFPLDQLNKDDLWFVISEAVSRRFTSPGFGVVSTSVAVDDARTDRRFEAQLDAELITPDLWALLTPKRRRRGAFTISPSYAPDVRRAW